MSRSAREYLQHMLDETRYVDYDIVWDVITNHIPQLHRAVQAIIDQEYPDLQSCYGEYRWISMRMLGPGYAVIVRTERDDAVIRIISSRRANQDE